MLDKFSLHKTTDVLFLSLPITFTFKNVQYIHALWYVEWCRESNMD
jgi:hypothetical protein